jgi:hypothetical protein
MSFMPPPVAAAIGPLNPLETIISGINTNTYFIGLSMIFLNLGGRHLAMSLTPEQDKFFQNPWIRRGMLFIVIFVATRNIFTALWMSIGLVLVIGYLFNEHSDLYLFGDPMPAPPAPTPPSKGLTPEENDIYRRLHDKVQKESAKPDEKPETAVASLMNWYTKNMGYIREAIM